MHRSHALSKLALALVLACVAAAPTPSRADTSPGTHAQTKIVFHGHAAFEVRTPSGLVLFIDPWLTNPANPDKTPIDSVKKADYILVTHGHFDHVGDTVALAKKTGAHLVAPFELAQNLVRLSGFPEKQIGFDTFGNPGGTLSLASGEVTVTFVPAIHSSGMETKDGPGGTPGPLVYGGAPCGYVIAIKNGPTLYHTGDTAYFRDMELIAAHAPDVALVNIGGHFGMEPPQAADAARAVKAKLVVPMHFKTFPVLTQSASGFFADLDKSKIAHHEMAPGETLVFDGKVAELAHGRTK